MKDFLKYILLTVLAFSRIDNTFAHLYQKMPKDTLSILDARLSGKVSIGIRGAYNPNKLQPDLISAHYGECMDIRIKNMSDSIINVALKCGTILLSRDSSSQNMVVTKTLFYRLLPKQKIIDRVYAMCGQLHKNSPDIFIRYDVGGWAEEPLLRLAKVIEQTDNQNKAGQYAMWAVTDGATKDDLGEDFEALYQSQALLNRANIPIHIMGKHKQMAILQKQNKPKERQPEPTEPFRQEDKLTIGSSLTTLTEVEQTIVQSNIGTVIEPDVKEVEKDEFNSLEDANNTSTNPNMRKESENYWLLVASFSVILFGLYYLWKKKPKLPNHTEKEV
jgi:hypothetical protein